MFEEIGKLSPERRRLLISLVTGLIPAMAVMLYVRSVEKEHADKASLVPVLVAPIYIPSGTRLDPKMFEVRQIPKMYAQPSCVLNSDLLDEKGSALYENLLPIALGEQLTASKLCRIGLAGGFSWLIPEGRVALSLDLPPDKCVAGLIEPGDSVDILATLEKQGGSSSKSTTVTFFQNIKVLGVGNRLIGGRGQKKADEGSKETIPLKGPEESNPLVTLAVKPFEAAVITHAKEMGSLRLALRPLGDVRVLEMKPVDVSSLLGEGLREAPTGSSTENQSRENMEGIWKNLEESSSNNHRAR